MPLAAVHQENFLTRAEGPLHHPHQQHRSPVGIVLGVEDQRLQRRLGVARRRRQPVNDRLEHVLDALSGLGRTQDGAIGVESEVLVDLLLDPLDIGGGKVDLVDDRNHLEVVLECEVEVGDRLGFYALSGVDQQQGPLTGHQGPPHLVREVNVPRSVDEVEPVGLAVPRRVVEGHGVGLDGDATFALDVHRVEDLVAEITRLHSRRRTGSGGRPTSTCRDRCAR